MLGYSEAANIKNIKALAGIMKQVILITMRNPQSHPNITTIILKDDSINVDNSNIEPCTSKGLGKQKNVGERSTSILINYVYHPTLEPM